MVLSCFRMGIGLGSCSGLFKLNARMMMSQYLLHMFQQRLMLILRMRYMLYLLIVLYFHLLFL